MALSDVSLKGLKELASYLRRFPKDDDDAEQYWYQLAHTLRKRNKQKCDYTEQVQFMPVAIKIELSVA